METMPAQKLVLMLPPDAKNLATKDDLSGLEGRLDVKFAQLEAALTRRMIAAMGAWTVLIGSAIAWAGLLLGR